MINPLILGTVLDLGKDLINRFIPNEEEKRKAEADFLRLAMDGELKQVIAQLEINSKEAMHASIFVAGWRPFFGWCGGVAFLYSTLLQPMLGIGGLRTFEKSKNLTK